MLLKGLTTEYRATFERLSLSTGSSARQSIPRSLSSGSSARQLTGPLLNANLSILKWLVGSSVEFKVPLKWLVSSSVDLKVYYSDGSSARQLIPGYIFQMACRLVSRLLRLIPPSKVSGIPKVMIIMQNIDMQVLKLPYRALYL